MNRWTTGIIVVLLGGLLSSSAFAQGPWEAPGVQQAGHHHPVYPVPSNPQGWHNTTPPETYQQLVPHGFHPRYDNDSRLDLTLGEALSQSWLRLDYLLWKIDDGAGTLLGAPTLSGFDLSGQDRNNRLPAIDPINGARPVTSAIVPRLGGGPDELNGIRGSIGIPTLLGTFEADVWRMQDYKESIVINPTVDQPFSGVSDTLIGAMTLLSNGSPSDTAMILFSDHYQARYLAQLWGTEGNWVFNPFTPNVEVQVSPIIGFRYLRMRDSINVTGQDTADPINAPENVLNHQIQSESANHVFGPQIGLRIERNVSRIDLGVDALFVAGINRIEDVVHTEQIYSATEAARTISETRTRFAPMLDLALYARVHLNDHVSLHVGYDLLLGGGFSRSYDNIVYDAPSNITDPSQIRLDPMLSKFYAHGLNVGGCVSF